MARGTWSIAVKESGGTWVSDGTIYIPNSNLGLETVSTQTRVQLANGSFAYIRPETKYNISALKFAWFYLPKTFKDKIEGYIQDASAIRITDHNSNLYYGRFTSIQSTWLAGEDNKYDVTAEFEQIPSLA